MDYLLLVFVIVFMLLITDDGSIEQQQSQVISGSEFLAEDQLYEINANIKVIGYLTLLLIFSRVFP